MYERGKASVRERFCVVEDFFKAASRPEKSCSVHPSPLLFIQLAALADYRKVCDKTILLDTFYVYERDYSLCVTLLTSATNSASLR